MTIAASFAVGLIGLAAMFALTDGDNETVAEAGSEETADSTAAAEEGGDQEQQAATSSETQPDATTAEAAASTTADTIDVAGGTETAPDGEVNPLLDPVGAMASAAENGRLDLMSLEFVPGTETLTPQSVSLVEALGPRLAELATPITISVRANGAATAQGNLDLSDQQATALVAALVAAGVPETQIRTVGLGAGPLSASLPVPDFVAATPELGDAAFSNSVAASGPFTIGSSLSDPATFRVEGVTDAVRLRQAMDRFTDSTIGLAAYSFFAPDNQSARAAAGRLADSVVAELTSGAVTADRITVITPGAAPYVVTPELGGHVWLQTGSESSMAFEVAGIDSTTITFEPNTASLTADGQAALDQLAVAVNAGVGSLTIDVRTYSEPTPEANTTLSQQQAAEIGRYLSEIGGVDAGRLRSFGSGPTTYYPDNGGSTVTLTVGPAN